MRIFILFVCTLMIVSLTVEQLQAQKSVNKIIDQVKKDDHSITLTVPGWLIRKAISLGLKSEGEHEDTEIWENLKDCLGKIRFSVVDHKDMDIDQEKIDQQLKNAIEKDGFQDYAIVKDKGTRVRVMVREKEGNIRNVFIYASADNMQSAIHIKTDIPQSTFKKAAFSFNKNNELHETTPQEIQ